MSENANKVSTRAFPTNLLVAIIMGELPPNAADLYLKQKKEAESLTNVAATIGLETEDLQKLAAAKVKRETKAARKEQQRISAKVSRMPTNN